MVCQSGASFVISSKLSGLSYKTCHLLTSFFSNNFCFILFCSAKDQIHSSAYSDDKILSNQEVIKLPLSQENRHSEQGGGAHL